jgi:HD-GYP domain-containing protein (c-di-GMP phosphodiesterase class II)
MHRDINVNLLNLVLSLSDALDLAGPEISQHQIRTAFIVWELGRAANMRSELLDQLFISALFHDIGALSPDEKIAVHNDQVADLDAHCIRGQRLLETVPMFKPCAGIVRFHHRLWPDWDNTTETDLGLQSQILGLADRLERFIDRDIYILHQNEDLISRISSLSNHEINPLVIDLLKSVAVREDFWLDIVSPRLYAILLRNAPCRGVEIELEQLIVISEFVRNLIDFRSEFTITHSAGVSAAASTIADLFGLTELETELMKVAGNLHDLGKVAIPNAILEKPDKLTDQEFAVMRQHTYLTHTVLGSIGGIQQITEWAAFHHEKLDGSGYPFHLDAKRINTGARIVAVADVFTALAEDRPYRKGLNKEGVLSVLRDWGAKNLLDKNIIGLVDGHYEQIHRLTGEAQRKANDTYRLIN